MSDSKVITQTFSYQPITDKDGIRLIVLHPASPHSNEIHCSLVNTTISRCDYELIEPYTTLSYVWGDATNLKVIFIHNAPLQITSSLHSALKNIRDATRPMRIWADAICINQNDGLEKDQQVKIMGKIYATAHHTIIFLGDFDIDIGFNNALDPPTELTQDQKNMILSRPWFRRVWIFQELVLSKDPWVQIGKSRLRWNEFFKLLTQGLFTSPNTDFDESLQILRDMHAARQNQIMWPPVQSPIVKLVSDRRRMGASDARDMIWAHVGLASDDERRQFPELQSNYENMSLAKLYNDFACHQIEQRQSFRAILHHLDLSTENRLDGLASWAPDWRKAKPTFSLDPFWDRPGLDALMEEWDSDELQGQKLRLYPVMTAIPQGRGAFASTDLPILLHIGTSMATVVKHTRPLSFKSFPAEQLADLTSRYTVLIDRYVFYREQIKLRLIMDDDRRKRRELFDEIYGAWVSVVQDENILSNRLCPSGLRERDSLFLNRIGISKVREPSFPEGWLVASLRPDFDKSFIEGRCLAVLSNRDLILTSPNVRVGDFLYHEKGNFSLDSVSLDAYLNGPRFLPLLLRPYPSLYEDMNDSVRTLMKEAPKCWDWPSSDVNMNSIPIFHCEIVGRAFLHQDNKWFGGGDVIIFAIH